MGSTPGMFKQPLAGQSPQSFFSQNTSLPGLSAFNTNKRLLPDARAMFGNAYQPSDIGDLLTWQREGYLPEVAGQGSPGQLAPGAPTGLESQTGAAAPRSAASIPGMSVNSPGAPTSGTNPIGPTANPPTAVTNPPALINPQSLPSAGTSFPVGSANTGVSPLDTSLANEFMNYLQSKVGSGADPFGQSVNLPTGGATAPGTLTPKLNAPSQQLFNLASGAPTTTPGASTLNALSAGSNPIQPNIPASLQSAVATGNPVDQTAAWQAMVAAEQQQIDRQAANLREQYNVGGANPATSSVGAQGLANYFEQTALGQTAQLTQAQAQALENAANRQVGAGEFVQGQGQQAQEFTQQQQQNASQFLTGISDTLAQTFQGYDQTAITNALNEFIRTNPEYSPLLNAIYGAATTFPPTVPNQYSPYLTALIGIIPSLISAIPKGGSGGAGGAGGAGAPGPAGAPGTTPTVSTGPTQQPTPQPQPTSAPPQSTVPTVGTSTTGFEPYTSTGIGMGTPTFPGVAPGYLPPQSPGDLTLPGSVPIPGVNAPVPPYVDPGLTYGAGMDVTGGSSVFPNAPYFPPDAVSGGADTSGMSGVPDLTGGSINYGGPTDLGGTTNLTYDWSSLG